MTDIETRDNELHWGVFVTPGIPYESLDLPPGTQQRMWSPMASTLIYGERDAMLVDAFMTIEQAHALGEWVEANGKHLTTHYTRHGHGDNFSAARTVHWPGRRRRCRLQRRPSLTFRVKHAHAPRVDRCARHHRGAPPTRGDRRP